MKYLISDSGNITLVLEGIQHQISSDHPNYDKIREAIKDKDNYDVEQLLTLIDVKATLDKFNLREAASENPEKILEDMEKGMDPTLSAFDALFGDIEL